MKDEYAGSGPAAIRRASNFEHYAEYWQDSPARVEEKLSDFTKYVPREALARFLVKYEIFQRILYVQGSVVECGVFNGSGLLAFAQISEMLEPLNHQRKIIGFDTWEGFPAKCDIDISANAGDFAGNLSELQRGVDLFNSTRYLSHIPKVLLVKGDINETVPEFVEDNQHLVVSLLYLDCDLYEPTRTAINVFLPRMPRGAVIAFDELNDPYWPGETAAVLDELGISNRRIERSFATSISYVVLE